MAIRDDTIKQEQFELITETEAPPMQREELAPRRELTPPQRLAPRQELAPRRELTPPQRLAPPQELAPQQELADLEEEPIGRLNDLRVYQAAGRKILDDEFSHKKQRLDSDYSQKKEELRRQHKDMTKELQIEHRRLQAELSNRFEAWIHESSTAEANLTVLRRIHRHLEQSVPPAGELRPGQEVLVAVPCSLVKCSAAPRAPSPVQPARGQDRESNDRAGKRRRTDE